MWDFVNKVSFPDIILVNGFMWYTDPMGKDIFILVTTTTQGLNVNFLLLHGKVILSNLLSLYFNDSHQFPGRDPMGKFSSAKFPSLQHLRNTTE